MILLVGDRPAREGGARALGAFYCARALGQASAFLSNPVTWFAEFERKEKVLCSLLENLRHVNLTPYAYRSLGEQRHKKKHTRYMAKRLARDLRDESLEPRHAGLARLGVDVVEFDEVWLAGRRVADAFRVRFEKHYELSDYLGIGKKMAVVPHPSTVNSWWESEGREEELLAWLKEKAASL